MMPSDGGGGSISYEVKEVVDRIETRVDAMGVRFDGEVQKARHQAANAQQASNLLTQAVQSLKAELDELKDANRWLARTIILAFLGLLVEAAVIAFSVVK